MKDPITTNNPIYEKPLKKGHNLTILEKEGMEIVQVRNANGLALFTIEISDQGTNLNIEAQNINLIAERKLNISADDVQISSNSDTIINTKGNFKRFVQGHSKIETKGDSSQTARTQLIKANLGDVTLRANDDVKLTGERIKLN